MSRYFSASTEGPPSIGLPLPLKMRPIMSSDTGVRRTCEAVFTGVRNMDVQRPQCCPAVRTVFHSGVLGRACMQA
jgi:hypothetical protein